MKPSRSALFGVVVISGALVSLVPVAVADGETARLTTNPSAKGALATWHHGSGSAVGTCDANAHRHSSSCACALCTAAEGTHE